jgi:hypothetical protein
VGFEQPQSREGRCRFAGVQAGVTIVSVAADRTLLVARENRILTRIAAARGQHNEMNPRLKAAADALDNYRSYKPAHAEKARKLTEKIRTYNQNESRDNNTALQNIDRWWEETQDWTVKQ